MKAARVAGSLTLAFLLAVVRPAWSMGLLEKNHPRVDEGRKAYERGQYQQALEAFDRAKQELPGSAAVEYNRGNALYKLNRHEEAAAAYKRATEMNRGELGANDYYNMGNALSQAGKRDDAVRAYRQALLKDPQHERARRNLERVLRQVPPPQDNPDAGSDGDGGTDPDAGTPDGGGSDAGSDQPSQPQQADGGEQQNQADGGGQQSDQQQPDDADAGSRREDAGTPPEPREGEARFDGGLPVEKQEAEKLLDSMKQTEKNLQLWRFQKKKQKVPNEKDW
jgi:tetratricopeptide (TPR) repeat protein